MANQKTVISSLTFKFMERIVAQGLTFLIGLILARLLRPEDYGVLAILLVFTNLAQVFVQGGLSTALIQNKDADETAFSSCFYLTLGLAVFTYVLLYLAAPAIERFYHMPQLGNYLRVLALILFPSAVNSIQVAYLSREMLFRKQFYVSLVSAIISGAIGVFIAYAGMGAWALVGQQLSSQIVSCLMMLVLVGWRPAWIFSRNKAQELFQFGYKLLISGMLDTLYKNVTSLVIGKKFSSEMLGYYSKGETFPNYAIIAIDSSINAVMLPVFSSSQEEESQLKRMMRRSLITSAFVIFPIMAGLVAVATPLIRFLLTEKWLPAVPFLQLSCLVYAAYPIFSLNIQAITARGRSDYILRLEIARKVVGLAVIAIAVICFDSVAAIIIGQLIATPICVFICSYPSKLLLNYGTREQLNDLLPAFLLSGMMGGLVWCLTLLNLPDLLTLILQIVSGAAFYFGVAKLLHFETIEYGLDMVKKISLSNKRNNQL